MGNPGTRHSKEFKAEAASEGARLKKELRRVEEEQDILRKTAAYFAKQSE